MTGLADLAALACSEVQKAGADASDVYLTNSRRLSVDIYGGKPEVFEQAEVTGAGLRAFKKTAAGFAYTTDLSPAGICSAARRAVDNAAATDEDEFNRLPDEAVGQATVIELGLTSENYAKPTTADKIDFALAMEAAASAVDARVKGCEKVTYAEEAETVALVNSGGFAGEYERQVCYGFIDVLAEENGETQTGFYYTAGHSLAELDAAATGQEAGRRAVAMLGGRPLKPRRLTAVFDPLVFSQILMTIAPAFSGESAQKGRSFLAGETGRSIGASNLTLIDDGRLPKGLGTAPFDDEGVLTKATPVIRNGVLETFLYNAYAARKAGCRPTGNGRRGSYKALPGTSPTNFYVKPGGISRQELIRHIDDGLYVLGLQGLHAGVNSVTGQFSAGAFGLAINDGVIGGPVREVTLASTCCDILANVVSVADDLIFLPMGAAYGSPTVAVSDVVISGR